MRLPKMAICHGAVKNLYIAVANQAWTIGWCRGILLVPKKMGEG